MTIDHTTNPPTGEMLAPRPTRTPPDRERGSRREPPERPRGSPRSLQRQTQRWSRVIHVYTSMVALLVVLFFAGTGILLNHPEWAFGSESTSSTVDGTFPFPTELVGDDGAAQGPDFLTISEYVRSEHGVIGEVAFFGSTGAEGSVAYRNPGYSADLFFSVDDGTYELEVVQQGWVAKLSDLHKGSESGSSWGLLIDATAVFLILIALTGLVMQVFLKKRRRSAFLTVGAGVAVTAVLMVIAFR